MKASLVFLAVLGAGSLVQAQMPNNPPSPEKMAQHQVQRYTTLLSLTPAQVEQATTLFTTEATTRSSSHASERSAHQALETAIKANDKQGIQSAAATLGQMGGEMMATHALTQAQFYAMLTADQKAKYDQLEEEHLMGGPGPGHGPPMR